MSRIWTAEQLGDTMPVSGFGDFGSLGRQPGGDFRSHFGEDVGASRAWNVTMPGQRTPATVEMFDMAEEPLADAIDPIEQAAQEAFLQGFREGERITREAAEADNAVREQLTHALGHIAQTGEGTLAAMLSQAVVRLVGQIMGEVAIDEELLKTRCAAVAACMDSDDSKAVLEVNPEDLPLLEAENMGVALTANAALIRGSVRLATHEGWVEDGPDIRLSRLKALLDDMEGKR